MQTIPQLIVSQWLNTEVTPADMHDKVVVVYAFQMLCSGCVLYSLPQAKKVAQAFTPKEVLVIGLHSVFEHHDAMTAVSLKAFLYENKIGFPVAIDQPSDASPLPKTMQHYAMRGTPTLLLFDKQGVLCHDHFGHVDDLLLGAEIMALILKK